MQGKADLVFEETPLLGTLNGSCKTVVLIESSSGVYSCDGFFINENFA